MQMSTATAFLYHCGLLKTSHASVCAQLKDDIVNTGSTESVSPVQWIVRIVRWSGNEDDFVGLMVAEADVSQCSLPRLLDFRMFFVSRADSRSNVVLRHLDLVKVMVD